MTTEEDNREKLVISTILEEYKALRAEILAQFQNRNQTLSFGSAALALLVSAGVTAVKESKAVVELCWVAHFVPMLFIPSVCGFITISWLIDSATIARIGSYIAAREREINNLFSNANNPTRPLYWETWLRSSNPVRWIPRLSLVLQSSIVLIVFGFIAYYSIIYTEKLPCPPNLPCKETRSLILYISYGVLGWSVYKIAQLLSYIYCVAKVE